MNLEMPIFKREPNGSHRKQSYIMGKRNWCSIELDRIKEDLLFDIRVEKERGCGETAGYALSPVAMSS